MVQRIGHVTFEHVRRELNKEADRLATWPWTRQPQTGPSHELIAGYRLGRDLVPFNGEMGTGEPKPPSWRRYST